MRDYLNLRLEENEIRGISNLGLAHIGDCVYELLVRSYVISHGRSTNRGLHAETVAMVSAKAQASAMEKISPLLTEEERTVFRRGRNTRVNSMPKNGSVGSYHVATGLECLFGWLYLEGRRERINQLFAAVVGEDEEA